MIHPQLEVQKRLKETADSDFKRKWFRIKSGMTQLQGIEAPDPRSESGMTGLENSGMAFLRTNIVELDPGSF